MQNSLEEKTSLDPYIHTHVVNYEKKVKRQNEKKPLDNFVVFKEKQKKRNSLGFQFYWLK